MSECATINFDIDEIALTVRDLVSLYLRYPDMQQPDQQGELYAEPPGHSITTSSSESSPQSTRLHSSPLPNLTAYESPASSPLGPPDIVPLPALTIAANEDETDETDETDKTDETDELTERFDLALEAANIPGRTAEFLAEMKSTIVYLGSIVFSAPGELTTDPEVISQVRYAADQMTSSLVLARKAATKEAKAAESVIELAPFTVRPGLKDVWTNYKQMAELIIKHTTVPFPPVLDLYIQLCHLYDACVYRPIMALPPAPGHDEPFLENLNSLYDVLMTLTTSQKQWTAAIKRIGNDFTKPTMQVILDSPEVMKTVLDSEGDLEALKKPAGEVESATKKVLTNLNTKHRSKRHQYLAKWEDILVHRRGAPSKSPV